tara:strand:+ start:2177 stop:2842 length:666 start_codon:yes stop_codon:yes gene_type:complete
MAEYDAETAPNVSSLTKRKLTKKEKLSLKHNRYSLKQAQGRDFVEPVTAKVIYGNGIAEIETTGNVYGVQIKYSGKLRITSKHGNPNNINNGSGDWIMSANNNTGVLLYFSFGGQAITGKQTLFTYRGNVKFIDIVISGKNTQIKGFFAEQLTDKFKDIDTNFNKLNNTFKTLKNKGMKNLSSKMETGYELIRKSDGVKNTMRNTMRRSNTSTSTSEGGSY